MFYSTHGFIIYEHKKYSFCTNFTFKISIYLDLYENLCYNKYKSVHQLKHLMFIQEVKGASKKQVWKH